MARLSRWGANELPSEPPRTLARSVLTELRETMILVLLGAAVLTSLTGDLADCAVILLVIAVNTTIGVVQERRVPAGEVMPGDVLEVKEGDVARADARVVTAHALQVDEALLTGESLPVDRDADAVAPIGATVGDRLSMLHAGTLVLHGTATGTLSSSGACLRRRWTRWSACAGSPGG